ncbi:MAG TPA: hypothetical protein VK907_00290 [Phnomibacter sp.]|nr:hypothetical protein [Phnomibacter sp.]
MGHVKKRLIDITAFGSRNMERDGNIDLGYWFDKTLKERLSGTNIMNEAAFGVSDFRKGKIEKTFFHVRKQA